MLDSTGILSIAPVKLGYNTEYTRKTLYEYALGTICRLGYREFG